jgi:carbon monoxide dehydrogenase subunit G
MRSIKVSRRIPSAPEKVWAVLADFPNIAAWNTGVAKSFATSDSTSGVGAQRHCDLAPFGELEETVKEWDDTRRMVISIDSAKKLPIARGQATFDLGPAGDGTEISVTYAYEPKFGVLGQIMGSLALDRQLTKGFKGFLKDLDAAAQ